jgi:hypothetical protein
VKEQISFHIYKFIIDLFIYRFKLNPLFAFDKNTHLKKIDNKNKIITLLVLFVIL